MFDLFGSGGSDIAFLESLFAALANFFTMIIKAFRGEGTDTKDPADDE